MRFVPQRILLPLGCNGLVFAKQINQDLAVGKLCPNLQVAAHGADMRPECADVHVVALFDFGDIRLADIHGLGDAFLRKPTGAPQFVQRVFRTQLWLLLPIPRNCKISPESLIS